MSPTSQHSFKIQSHSKNVSNLATPPLSECFRLYNFLITMISHFSNPALQMSPTSQHLFHYPNRTWNTLNALRMSPDFAAPDPRSPNVSDFTAFQSQWYPTFQILLCKCLRLLSIYFIIQIEHETLWTLCECLRLRRTLILIKFRLALQTFPIPLCECLRLRSIHTSIKK